MSPISRRRHHQDAQTAAGKRALAVMNVSCKYTDLFHGRTSPSMSKALVWDLKKKEVHAGAAGDAARAAEETEALRRVG
jgi:hypothetical protein